MPTKKPTKNILDGIDELSDIPEIPEEAEKAENFEEVLEDIQEASEELSEDIKQHLKDKPKKPEVVVSPITKIMPDQYLIDLNIPYCKKCFEPFSRDLAGNIQCFHGLVIDCPALED